MLIETVVLRNIFTKHYYKLVEAFHITSEFKTAINFE
jgi:hypothetical protein